MVEKIIINPNKVRGYGNIMSPHSSGDYSLEDCTIATGTDTVNGATETVYTLTPETTSIYSIAFDSSSYTTSDGSVTCYVTLLNNSVAVSGASISLTGTGSTLSATTNSSGVATFNLTGISADCTITATYSNVSDTATITVQVGPVIPYQQVEYLQSNGSQYINTGYKLKANDKVEVSVSMQGTGTYNGVFGARKNDYQHNAYALFGRFGSSNKFVYTRTGQEKSGNTINTNVIYDVTTQGSTCTIMQGDTLVQTLTNTGTMEDCVNPCGLFVLNTYNGADGFNKDTYGYMKIYSFKITDANNNVVMELYPVRDGTTGYMYDTVSEELMTNTGTFLYGSDI